MRKITIELEKADLEELMDLLREMNQKLDIQQDLIGALLAKAYSKEGRIPERH